MPHERTCRASRLVRCGLTVLLALGVAGVVHAAAYVFDPSAAHEKGAVNAWFGSARSTDGRYLPGVTMLLETRKIDYVIVTDARGRFRIKLPLDLAPADVTPRCSRAGYRQARISKRLPPGGRSSPVQVDCFLEPRPRDAAPSAEQRPETP